MRLFGLIGYPLAQSFSKKYFSEKFEKEGLADCRYELFEIQSIDELPGILQAHPDLEGFNVTIPYKQAVVKYLHEVDQLSRDIKACNCIQINKGLLSGHNTDAAGFEKSFIPLLKPYHKKALVLGNGGAAAAVVYVLKNLGIGYSIVSRQLHDGSAFTYKDLNEEHIKEHLVIINTTPVGSFPATEVCPGIPYQFITGKHYLFDVVYNPPKSLFLQKGEVRGAFIKNGYDWLVLQAEESWRIWNGK
jgi:shikimate dehydrogenase